ncbi:MAG: 23S rRNA (uracil1939-C5)-methyltransferase [Glaciecola sp.]|jgi:23S rRNA (uracil1939-C5)-methyltransferase
MARRRKQLPIFENVEIIDAGSEGKAVAKIDEMVLFITGGIPGDICDVQVTKKKKSFMEGRILKLHKLSDKRQKAFCSHFGVCGGCKWQELNYDDQLIYKQKQVQDNFKHLGKFEFPEIQSILPSEKTQYYRNKLEFTFSNKKWLTFDEMGKDNHQMNALGFHIPRKFDKIVNVDHCYLQGDFSNDIRNEVRDFALKNEFTFFDIRQQHGFLRNLIIRTSSTGDIMVVVCFFENKPEAIEKTMKHLGNTFPQITSLMYVVNEKKNDTISDLEIQLYGGNPFIMEEMEGIKFKIGPKSFYQTNSEQAYELYKITRDFAGITENDTVYDLYTGTGTIANFVAKNCKKVVGVEYIPDAIEDAKVNSKQNNIENTSFFAGDMKDILNDDFIAENGQPDVIITDPPRAGMHEDVLQVILNAEAKKVVYVSCNPATQARDLNFLDQKYKVTKVRPVDMFPHTHHVENVVLLELRD